jgi:hypothetical protein
MGRDPATVVGHEGRLSRCSNGGKEKASASMDLAMAMSSPGMSVRRCLFNPIQGLEFCQQKNEAYSIPRQV